jgi:hypothetical protein
VIKSVHIKECWPYEYVAPVRRLHKREAMDRQNELRRARYAKAKAIKTPKSKGSKKLLGLRVFDMNDDICERLNNAIR